MGTIQLATDAAGVTALLPATSPQPATVAQHAHPQVLPRAPPPPPPAPGSPPAGTAAPAAPAAPLAAAACAKSCEIAANICSPVMPDGMAGIMPAPRGEAGTRSGCWPGTLSRGVKQAASGAWLLCQDAFMRLLRHALGPRMLSAPGRMPAAAMLAAIAGSAGQPVGNTGRAGALPAGLLAPDRDLGFTTGGGAGCAGGAGGAGGGAGGSLGRGRAGSGHARWQVASQQHRWLLPRPRPAWPCPAGAPPRRRPHPLERRLFQSVQAGLWQLVEVGVLDAHLRSFVYAGGGTGRGGFVGKIRRGSLVAPSPTGLRRLHETPASTAQPGGADGQSAGSAGRQCSRSRICAPACSIAGSGSWGAVRHRRPRCRAASAPRMRDGTSPVCGKAGGHGGMEGRRRNVGAAA